MLPKAHLTSHSRMSGSRWVITPLCLSWSWRSFLYSSVYSCHLLISYASVFFHATSVLYWAHLCMNCSLGITNFLEEISSFSHSVVFLYFFALIAEEGFLSLLIILWNSVLKCVYISFFPLPLASLFYSAILKASSDNSFAFLHFFFLGMVLLPVSCTMPWTSVHSSSGTLSDLGP